MLWGINQTENGIDPFCKDTRQNALAALTNLGHVTNYYTIIPSIHPQCAAGMQFISEPRLLQPWQNESL